MITIRTAASILFLILFTSNSFAQNGGSTHSVEMRPGTTPPDLPSHNLPPDLPQQADPIQDADDMKLNISEMKIKKNGLPEQKASATPTASPHGNY